MDWSTIGIVTLLVLQVVLAIIYVIYQLLHNNKNDK